MKQANEVERVLKWVCNEDGDGLVRSHAETVLEGLETWNMKKLFKFRDAGLRLNANLGLEGNLRGLSVQPLEEGNNGQRKTLVVEEIE